MADYTLSYTGAQINALLQKVDNFLNNVYPVGAIYISTNGTDPGTLFGGTWQAIEGKFLIGADSTYTAGQTGGSTNHTHTLSHTHTMAHTHTYAHTHTTPATNTGSTAITVAQMPSHDHGGKTGNDTGYNSTWGVAHLHNSSSPVNQGIGSGQHGSPYVAAYADGMRHTHTISAQGSGNGHSHSQVATTTNSQSTSTTSAASNATTSAASNETTSSASNLPPYLAVYMWKRIA